MISKSYIISIFCFVTFFAYSPSFFGWYQSDDMIHLQRFTQMDLPGMISHIWSGHTYEDIDRDQHYRPIANTFLWAALNMHSVPLARILIFLVHLLNGFLLYRILSRDSTLKNMALWGMAIFLLLPAASHAVLWMSAVGDLLCVTFVLLMVLQLQAYFVEYKKKRLLFAILLFLLSFLSKEMSISVPFILFVYMVATQRKNWIAVPLIFFAVLLAAFVIRHQIINTVVMGSTYNDTLLGFGPRTIIGLTKYAVNFLVPAHGALLFTSPLFYLFSLPTIALIVGFYRGNSTKKIMIPVLFLSVIILSISPVVNLCNPWYLYYPAVLVTILILHFAKDQKKTIRTCLLFIFIFVNSACVLYLSVETAQIGRFTQKLSQQIRRLPENSVRIINLPVMVRGGALSVHSGSILTLGIQSVHPDFSKKITFAGRKIVCSFPSKIILTILSVHHVNVSTVQSKGKEYFLISEEAGDIPVKYNVNAVDRIKKATNIIISWDDTIPTYIATYH